ncbi:hypothetical protein ACFWA5_06460 [Streptomyces mirabilis]|uniref:hypothetical protein n=1 Tax=Streptomyces mirabilis TaxID=68239 RepID=UPI003668ED30
MGQLIDEDVASAPRGAAGNPAVSWAATAWQRALRRPVALALPALAALHLPADLAALVSGVPGGHLLPAVVAALCLCSGAAPAARDTAATWWAASVWATDLRRPFAATGLRLGC